MATQPPTDQLPPAALRRRVLAQIYQIILADPGRSAGTVCDAAAGDGQGGGTSQERGEDKR